MAEDMNKTNGTNNDTGKPEEGNTQPQNNDNGGAANPPANVEGEKKGFHPIQGIKDWKDKFVTEHPVAARRIRKGVDIAEGAVIGGAAVFVALATIGAKQENGEEDFSDLMNPTDNNPNVIDTTSEDITQ